MGEIQGMYGAFSFSEKLLQKIWLRGDFDRSNLRTTSGETVRVRHPGKWNLMGGPDFRGAQLGFGAGPERTGDVELHLHASDWEVHRHAEDPAYDGVLLHVVLFPIRPGHTTVGRAGREIPVLVLLPLLHHDLEEFAADDAVEALSDRIASRIPEELGSLDAASLTTLLEDHRRKRWQQKVHFARLRVRRLGRTSACHHGALEVLGYRYNRAPMLRLAAQFELGEWGSGRVDPDRLYALERSAWSLQGVRPANHPRVRLVQYSSWCRQRPAWPEQVEALLTNLNRQSIPEVATRALRRGANFPRLRASWAESICAGTIRAGRLDTFICDCLLPLIATDDAAAPNASRLWTHWFVGDVPPVLTRALRQLAVCTGREQPATHGLVQGLLGWMIAREAQRLIPRDPT